MSCPVSLPSSTTRGLLPGTAALLQVDRLRSSLERASVERRAAVQASEPGLVEVEVPSSGVYRDSVHLTLLACCVGISDLHALAAGGLVVGSPGRGDDAVVVLEDVDKVLVLRGNTSAGLGARAASGCVGSYVLHDAAVGGGGAAKVGDLQADVEICSGV